MKKVLFISYTMPPYAGAGAQASTHYVKHLREFGWEPIVLTVEGNAWERDPLRPGPTPEFMRELPADLRIYRTPAFQPFRLLRMLKDMKLLWAYRFFVRPDERLPWSLSVIPSAIRIIREHDVELMFTSTVQAWSTSFLGLLVKKVTGKPWVLHSEDPWTQWPMGVWPTRLHYKLEERLERLVLRSADAINMVWSSYRQEVLPQHPMLADKTITWIPCGYDEEDFAGRRVRRTKRSKKMIVLHSGVFYHRWGELGNGRTAFLRLLYRNTLGRLEYAPFEIDRSVHSPRYLMEALRQLVTERPEVGENIELHFTGKVDPALEQTVQGMGLKGRVQQLGYLDREEFLNTLCGADVMFLPMSRFADGRRVGWLTLKLYEYLATGKPVLAAAPESDAKDILERAGVGLTVEPDDVEGLKSALVDLYRNHVSGGRAFKPNWAYIRCFEWRHLTQRLAALFDQTLGLHPCAGRPPYFGTRRTNNCT